MFAHPRAPGQPATVVPFEIAGLFMRYAAIFLGAAACGNSSGPYRSADYDASELVLSAALQSNGSVTQVDARLFDVDQRFVTLSGADRLLLTASGDEGTLVAVTNGYLGQIETGATDCALVLEREGGARLASPFPLPPPFMLSPPAAPVLLSQPFTFTWSTDAGASRRASA